MTGTLSRVLVIFDCDGVLVDSEPLANRELAAMLTQIGLQTTTEQSIADYMGRTWNEIESLIESRLGKSVPSDFKDRYYARIFEVFDSQLEPVDGIEPALAGIQPRWPTCVASSGSHEKMRRTLGLTGLRPRFPDERIFSAWDVARGKPAPDLFLHAARRMGFDPATTAVVEDSLAGVQAARAAGMRALAFTRHTGADVLAGAGGEPFADMAELPGLLAANA